MSLAIGARVGTYEILAPLGVGGMGEVYRARDRKLDRDVAIKILPASSSADQERIARFDREARTLAALNCSNIAQIYGLEEWNGVRALAMELVEGPTLAERIARGPIPIDESLAIAGQIAAALEAAHEQGIVHRDLKPANIKVRDDGVVKVLDFGLAKALEPTGTQQPAVTQSPTITTPAMMTGIGMILGTAAYMSPEQAKGRAADKRADIWAFGCVLYEMVTGTRAFAGEDVSDTLAAILRGEPDWTLIPDDVPAQIKVLLRRCLEKDRTKRVAHISTAGFLIAEPISSETPGPSRALIRGHASTQSWRPTVPAMGYVLAAGLLVGASAWALRPSIPSAAVTRFAFPLPPGQQFTNAGRRLVALSSDGMKTAYVANGRLYMKDANRFDSVALTGTDGALLGVTGPAFSPDGRFVAFWSSDARLQKVAAGGGTPLTLCPADNPNGITWADDDTILFASDSKGIMRVSANGGSPELLVAANGDELLAAPEMLPDGRTLMYTVAKGGAGIGAERWDKAQVVVQSLRSSQRSVIIDGGSEAHYVTTGHIVYAVSGVLFAVPFDLRLLRATAGPTPVLEGVRRASNGATSAANFGVSRAGLLMYVPGPTGRGGIRYDLALIDSRGIAEPLKLPPNQYVYPRVSPDGRKVALAIDDGDNSDIWVYELSDRTLGVRLTFGGRNRFPVWNFDGARLAFQSDRDGDRAIFWQRTDSPGGAAERLTRPAAGEVHIPTSWSPNDDVMLFTVTSKGDTSALWTFSRESRKTSPFDQVKGTGPHPNGVFSPDGRWVAYTSIDVVGRPPQVFVQPFPPNGARFQVGPGVNAMWSRDGKQLFFSDVVATNFGMVDVSTRTGFRISTPTSRPRPSAILLPAFPRNYDVLPDGEHFVIVVNAVESGGATSPGLSINYVLNWFEELKAQSRAR